MPPLPEPSEEMAPLPRVIRTLVQRRRTVKELIKGERDPVGGLLFWMGGRVLDGWGCMGGQPGDKVWAGARRVRWVGGCVGGRKGV